MTIRKWISILLVLALLLPSAGSAARLLLAPAEAGHGCCPSQAAAAETAPDAGRGIHGDCSAGCAGQCDACLHCTGLALPSTASTRCAEIPTDAPGFSSGDFPGFFPPVELRPPRTLA